MSASARHRAVALARQQPKAAELAVDVVADRMGIGQGEVRRDQRRNAHDRRGLEELGPVLDGLGRPFVRPLGLHELEAVLDPQLEDRDPDPPDPGRGGRNVKAHGNSPADDDPLRRQGGQVQCLESVGVGNHVDRRDPVAGERQVEHQQQPALRRHDDAQRAIHQRGRAACALPLKLAATASAPRSSATPPRRMAARSARRTTSGSSTASSPAISPLRAAARKASTTLRWLATSASDVFAWSRARAGGPGWRAAGPPSASGRRWARSPRTAGRTCRAARRRRVRPAPALPARRATPGRHCRQARPRARDRLRAA